MRFAFALLLVVVSGCGPEELTEDDLFDHAGDGSAEQGLLTAPVLVNECRASSGGYVELINTNAVTVDLYRDASRCFWVDDKEGGASPRLVTDSNVHHAAGSVTCAEAGRSSACALVAPGERVWLSFTGVDGTYADACRLLSSTYASGSCGTTRSDLGVGGVTSGAGAAQCYGRAPDGAAWSSKPLAACTPFGASNSGTPAPASNAIVLNEFSAGSSGWVELYNTSDAVVAMDGWQVDDVANGGASPKIIAAQNEIASHGTMLVFFSGINTSSADQVRLVNPDGVEVDSHPNGYAGSSISGKCFGRSPSGGSWASGAINCTPNAVQ